ncbi:UBIQUITIN-CONJUGAT-2 domain-containing protein [Mycena sanguinolenta]|uniref:UBIQUITIN-CONJUGAT-2 domain-containing protein n=1 Tax=Mycena sanguinolenta TaxID=230812 RepID=A0A8H6XI32_9AGAR|nr:UBIQUITIN-CONJUGAT-2 domain-containing protein [Mycena sanguinolenta]
MRYAALERGPEEVARVYQAEIQRADKDEAASRRRWRVQGHSPQDPLRDLGKGEEINLESRIRRFAISSARAIASSATISSRPSMRLSNRTCATARSGVCTYYYQYYAHNRGASLEVLASLTALYRHLTRLFQYEIIHNSETVDLLVSLCYCAAAEDVLDEPLSKGMALHVLPPDKARITTPPTSNYHAYHHGQQPAAAPATPLNYQSSCLLADEYANGDDQMRASIAGLIDTLPPIDEMNEAGEVEAASEGEGERDDLARVMVDSALVCRVDGDVGQAAYPGRVDSVYRQFRFGVVKPDAEARFQKTLPAETLSDANAKKYPSWYVLHAYRVVAFRGRFGPKNWHSIVRRVVANGHTFGDYMYIAKKDVDESLYRQRPCLLAQEQAWPYELSRPRGIVDLPQKFVSSNPHFVVKDTEWIMWYSTLIKGIEPAATDASAKTKKNAIPLVKLDPAQAITLMSKTLRVPQPGYEIGELEESDETDTFVFEERKPAAATAPEVIDVSDDEPMLPPPLAKGTGKNKGSSFVAAVSSSLKGKGSTSGSSSAPKGPPKDDWKHDAEYVRRTVELFMPPPLDSSPSATMAVQRELKTMIKEQGKATTSASGLEELGCYSQRSPWAIIDLKREKVYSSILEIRFPPTYRIGPPFFRIITPRFLPFIQGGGGHVTGGGFICMDLLTSDGWLPSYSISAVLVQIKLAISNLDPRPARLAGNWNPPYPVAESLASFKRAAATHGRTVPEDSTSWLDR